MSETTNSSVNRSVELETYNRKGKYWDVTNEDMDLVKKVMSNYVEDTGLDPEKDKPRRYLWTDAFAVCQLMDLWKRTGEEKWKELGLKLVDQVHRVLGRHRSDDKRKGWISGLSEDEGKLHPTKGGLRIGKKDPERAKNEPYDDRAEWDNDGQYYHYLTKWMQALVSVSRFTGDEKYSIFAAELAKGVHSKFVYNKGATKRMYWKMSIDLSRPLVPSQGHHDPLDGYITYHQVKQALPKDSSISLDEEIKDLEQLVFKDNNWATNDPLGLGGILVDSYRVYQLQKENNDNNLLSLCSTLVTSSNAGLKSYSSKQHNLPAQYRLAFREFGLSIGLKVMGMMHSEMVTDQFKMHNVVHFVNEILHEFGYLADDINKFWNVKKNRDTDTWIDHKDINDVMWATSHIPHGYIANK